MLKSCPVFNTWEHGKHLASIIGVPGGENLLSKEEYEVLVFSLALLMNKGYAVWIPYTMFMRSFEKKCPQDFVVMERHQESHTFLMESQHITRTDDDAGEAE